jgi:hypothetical protein
VQVRRVLKRGQLRNVWEGAVDAACAGRQRAHGDAAAAIVDGVRPPHEVESAGRSIDEDIVHLRDLDWNICRSWLLGGERRRGRLRCQAACFSLPAGRGAVSEVTPRRLL